MREKSLKDDLLKERDGFLDKLRQSHDWEQKFIRAISAKDMNMFYVSDIIPVLVLDRVKSIGFSKSAVEHFLAFYISWIIGEIPLTKTYTDLQQLFFKAGIDDFTTNMFLQVNNCGQTLEEELLLVQRSVIDKYHDFIQIVIFVRVKDDEQKQYEALPESHIFKKIAKIPPTSSLN